MEYTILILLLPLLSFLFLGLAGMKLKPVVAGAIGTAVLAVVALLSYCTAFEYFSAGRDAAGMFPTLVPWNTVWLPISRTLHIDLGILLDPISVMMLVVISTVSLMVHVYSLGYMKGERGFQRYYAFLSLFTMSMMGLVVATNIFQMYLFWELVGVSSYLLIGFYYTKKEAVAASKKAFIVTRFADLGFLIGILIYGYYAGTFSFTPETHALVAAGAMIPLALGLMFIGGAGKSAVSAVAAATLASEGIKTLLLDCDFQFGDMRELLGAKRAYGVDEVLSGAVPLSDLPRDEQGLCLIAAPRRLEQSETIVHELPALLDSAMAHFDAIIANTGANWGEQHAVLLERSSRALFLVDQRASSLRACKHAVELCARCGIAASPFLFVANRCSKRSLFSSIDVSCAMRGAHAAELKDGGVEVEQALGTGLAYDLVSSRNAFAQSVRELMGEVVGEAAGSLASSEESEAPSRGLFSFRRARREGVLP